MVIPQVPSANPIDAVNHTALMIGCQRRQVVGLERDELLKRSKVEEGEPQSPGWLLHAIFKSC